MDKPFVLGNKECISFKVLHEHSLRLARYLQSEIGQGKNIVLVAKNSNFFIVSYLGILKSGNVCVPLDYSIGQGNLDYILQKTDPQFIFYSSKDQSRLEFGECQILDEQLLSEIVRGGDLVELEHAFDQNALAEIVFTSGSTGEPKGVMLSHKNIMANTSSIIGYLKLNSDDIMCVVLPFHYCYGL